MIYRSAPVVTKSGDVNVATTMRKVHVRKDLETSASKLLAGMTRETFLGSFNLKWKRHKKLEGRELADIEKDSYHADLLVEDA